MFGEDPDFQKLIPIAPSIINEMKEEFRAKFEVVIKEMKHYVLKKSQEKEEEVTMIKQCISNVKIERDRECIKELESYMHRKKEVSFLFICHLNEKCNSY